MSTPTYAWDFSFLWGYRSLIAFGLGITIAYTIVTIIAGLIIGLHAGARSDPEAERHGPDGRHRLRHDPDARLECRLLVLPSHARPYERGRSGSRSR